MAEMANVPFFFHHRFDNALVEEKKLQCILMVILCFVLHSHDDEKWFRNKLRKGHTQICGGLRGEGIISCFMNSFNGWQKRNHHKNEWWSEKMLIKLFFQLETIVLSLSIKCLNKVSLGMWKGSKFRLFTEKVSRQPLAEKRAIFSSNSFYFRVFTENLLQK